MFRSVITPVSSFFLFLLFTFSLSAQTTADFENISVPAATGFLNNAAPARVFSSGNVALKNSFDPAFSVWDGWAVSTVKDNVSQGFTNQYSAIPGTGFGGSTHYVVGYAFTQSVVQPTGKAAGGVVEGVYVTNGTYPYFSMKDGDQFAKKFGGETGNDPDFFKLTIKKWQGGVLQPDTVEFFLADYRFANNSRDYIVKDWRLVNLRKLGNADSLQFTLSSSDVGQFGMNTPAYFCADRFITADVISTKSTPEIAGLEIMPNPATEYLLFDWQDKKTAKVTLLDLSGRTAFEVPQVYAGERVSLPALSSGVYFVKVQTDLGFSMKKIYISM